MLENAFNLPEFKLVHSVPLQAIQRGVSTLLVSSSALPPAPAATPTPRVLKAGSEASSPSPNVEELYVRAVPESHVVVAFVSAGAGIEEWDLLGHSVSMLHHQTNQLYLSRLSRPADNAQVQIRVEASTAEANPAPKLTPKFLAGVDDILTHCSQFCVRKFTMHASVNVVHGMSALLVTGRTGAGKTSIVQAVAKTLEQDPRTFTYTLYVDVARYATQPVHTIKALLQHWFKKASWHRPAVLILDNLKKLVGVESEHADSFRMRHIVSLYSASARSAAPNSRMGASSAAALHPILNGAHVFEDVVSVKAPSKNARKILARIVDERLSGAGYAARPRGAAELRAHRDTD
ncbi:hypothetical protein K438DRAFT_774138 [Mycena galopus ATCC 62051]|nr:hypothetical protein K438DRAFT_774138 [Mycena galopus ATCC 62051]